jgi:hypothetical protein
LQRTTPVTRISADDLDRARNQGNIRRADPVSGIIGTQDPVSPLVRVLNKRLQAELSCSMLAHRVIPITTNITLYCEKPGLYYFIRNRVVAFDFSQTYGSVSRAFQVWKDKEICWQDEVPVNP